MRIPPLILWMALIVTGGLAPAAHAYEILLDHNTDGNLYTINNRNEGPTEVDVTVIVRFTAAELVIPPSTIAFSIDWDCDQPENPYLCVANHGTLQMLPQPDSPVFGEVDVTVCLAIWCSCISKYNFSVAVDAPPLSSNQTLMLLRLSREGLRVPGPSTCLPETYESVEFRTPDAKFTVAAGPTTAQASPWSIVKGMYQNP